MRSSVRWFVPVAVAATVAGGVAVSSARADAAPTVPDRTAEQVLASVAGSHVTALSGTVVTKTDLGLPSLDLSGIAGGSGNLSPTDVQGLVTRFLSGRNTLRVWADGETKQRVQLVDDMGEFDVIHNGTQVWTYSSKRNEVGKATLPADAAKAHETSPTPSDLTPEAMAKRAIAAADPTTAVTLGEPKTVAGRAAYALTLTPRTKATLVDRIVIAVDAEKGLPLQVDVFSRGHRDAAIHTGFSSVDFSTPSADRFAFTPPKGATVTDLGGPDGLAKGLPGEHGRTPSTTPSPSATTGKAGVRPTVTGTGWASIVEFPAGTAALPISGSTGSTGSDQRDLAQVNGLVDQLTKPVSGGRVLTSHLVSVLITDNGRVLAGAVPVQTLVDAARR